MPDGFERACLCLALGACRPIIVMPCPSLATVTPTATQTQPATPTAIATPTATATTTATASTAPTTATPLAGYRRAWDFPGGGWNHAIAIAPNGDVLAAGGSQLLVLAHADGRVVKNVSVCSLLNGDAVFVKANDTAVVVCDDGVLEVSLSDFSKREVLHFPSWMDSGRMELRKERAAVGARVLAIADDAGGVELYALAAWKPIAAVAQSGGGDRWRIEGLAVWGDGRVAASWWDHGTFFLVDARNKTPWRGNTAFHSSGGLAFSPDGTRLFGETHSFRVGEMAIDNFAFRGDAPADSWLTEARYLDDKHVVTTGAHGLAIVALDTDSFDVLDKDTGEGLGVSSDGSFICAGGRSDHIACFSRL